MYKNYSHLRNDLYLKVENAEYHGLTNENKLVYLVKYKCKKLSKPIEKSWWIKRTEMGRQCLYWNIYAVFVMIDLPL